MWAPIEELRKMSRDERLGYLSFTSDDMVEQIITTLLTDVETKASVMDTFEELNQQIEFFKEENTRLVEENEELKEKIGGT